MPLDALLGLNSPCSLRGHGPITADQARTLAADGELRRLVCDPLSGTLLDYGRCVYQPPQQLTDHLLARDAMCTTPGCRQPASRCERPGGFRTVILWFLCCFLLLDPFAFGFVRCAVADGGMEPDLVVA